MKNSLLNYSIYIRKRFIELYIEKQFTELFYIERKYLPQDYTRYRFNLYSIKYEKKFHQIQLYKNLKIYLKMM